MASLQYQVDRQRKGWRLRFYIDRQRWGIWLGDISEKKARNAQRNLDELVEARKQACRPDAAAIKWAIGVDARIRKILLASDLLDEQTQRDISAKTLKLADYMDRVISEKLNVSDSWRVNYRQAKSWLFKFDRIPADKLLTELRASECEAWYEWMLTQLKPATAGQHLKRCRQLLKMACRDRLIPVNPMEGIRACSMQDKSRDAYVDEDSTARILKACDCQQWCVIVALTRIGGLRCPSEVFALRWSDIHWDTGTLKVTISKTARHGKRERTVPLFPKVRAELQALCNERKAGTECSLDSYVITRYRDPDTNLRTELARTLKRAGVPALEKPFMNFRASARTDLQRQGFPTELLNNWFGHTTAVAIKHYGRTTEEDLRRAATMGGILGGPAGGPEASGMTKQEVAENPAKARECGGQHGLKYTQMDSNH